MWPPFAAAAGLLATDLGTLGSGLPGSMWPGALLGSSLLLSVPGAASRLLPSALLAATALSVPATGLPAQAPGLLLSALSTASDPATGLSLAWGDLPSAWSDPSPMGHMSAAGRPRLSLHHHMPPFTHHTCDHIIEYDTKSPDTLMSDP